MPHSRYYSPRLERELVSRLYHAAKAQGVPMTRLASRLVRQGLDGVQDPPVAAESSFVAETAPKPSAPASSLAAA